MDKKQNKTKNIFQNIIFCVEKEERKSQMSGMTWGGVKMKTILLCLNMCKIFKVPYSCNFDFSKHAITAMKRMKLL